MADPTRRRRMNMFLLLFSLVALIASVVVIYLWHGLDSLRDFWLIYLGWLFLAASVLCGLLVLRRPDSRARAAWRNVTLIVGLAVNVFVIAASILIERMMRFW